MKISSFRLAEYFIRKFCSTYNLSFTDLAVEFSDIATPGLQDGKILLSDNTNNKLSHTLFQIVSIYIDNIETISAAEINLKKNFDKISISVDDANKVAFLNLILALLRDMSYGSETPKLSDTSLNMFPLVWLLIRDIVCPIFARGANNIDILVKNTPYIDGARYFSKDEMPGIDKNTIVLNSSVTNRSFTLAFLFVEAICSHNLHPTAVIHEIITKKEIKDRFLGILDLVSFKENDIENFLSTLSALTNIDISIPKTQSKTAQTIGQTWWYIGLIEKMLEPARGSDTKVRDSMAVVTKELWEKVEERKLQLGLNQLSMENLLRIQSEDYQNKPNLILQGLLSDVRVW